MSGAKGEREHGLEEIMKQCFGIDNKTTWVDIGGQRWPLPSKELALKLMSKVIGGICDDYGELSKKPTLETIGFKKKWYFWKGEPVKMLDHSLIANKKVVLEGLCELETERKRLEGLQ